MKRLTPPILGVYTDNQLALELDIPHHKITSLCKTGSIKADYKEKRQTLGGGFVRWGEPKPSTSRLVASWYEIQKEEALRFEAELFGLDEVEKLQNEQSSDKKRRDPNNPKSKNTLLQMIAVMAIKGYKYNPNDQRSTVPATIVNSAQSMGITLDQKTVRDWLQQAAECISLE